MNTKRISVIQIITLVALIFNCTVVSAASSKEKSKKDKGPRTYTLFKKNGDQASPNMMQPATTQMATMPPAPQSMVVPQQEASAPQMAPVKQNLNPSKTDVFYHPEQLITAAQSVAKQAIIPPNELDFEVQNSTGKTVYITCFSYVKKYESGRWNWDKTPVYKLDHYETAIVDVPFVPDEYDRKHVFGYLAVFPTQKEADEATYELCDDQHKVDLDLLYKLKGEKVVLSVERYGFKGESLDYDFVPTLKKHIEKMTKKGELPPLDFVVENRTGKPVWVTCFVYEFTSDVPVWHFEKSPITRLENGQQSIIDIHNIKQAYDRSYVRGYLGVFHEGDKALADESTFELLSSKNKIKLGLLAPLAGQKVVLDVEKYGVVGDLIDFTIKPIRRIQFSKAVPPASALSGYGSAGQPKPDFEEKTEEVPVKVWH